MIEYRNSNNSDSIIKLKSGENKNLNHYYRNGDGHIDSANVDLSSDETGGEYRINYDNNLSGRLENGQVLIVQDLIVRGGTEEQLNIEVPSIRVVNPNG